MSDALDLSRLRALAQQAKEPCANPECGDGDEVCPICQAVRELSYAVTPDVILHLVQRLERIEQWTREPITSVSPYDDHNEALRATKRAKAEVLRLLTEEGK